MIEFKLQLKFTVQYALGPCDFRNVENVDGVTEFSKEDAQLNAEWQGI